MPSCLTQQVLFLDLVQYGIHSQFLELLLSLFVSGKCNICTDGEPIVEVLDKLEGGVSMAMARQRMSVNLQSV
jgi:hypothetical protein